MAYFAQISDHNSVVRVIVLADADVQEPYPESEPIGQAYIADILGLAGVWLQTSYDGMFRGKFASRGDYYDPALDQFIPPPEPEPAP